MFKRHVLKELSSYLDNQLSDRKKFRVENHLQECKICSQELAKLKILSEKLKTWQVPALDTSFDNSLKNEIASWELEGGRFKMKKKTLTILIPSAALAGILVFLFVGQVYFKRGIQGGLREASENLGKEYVTKQLGPMYGDSSVGSYFQIPQDLEPNFQTTEKPQNATFNSYDAWSSRYYVAPAKSYLELKGSTQGADSTYAQTGEGSVIVIQPILPTTGEGEKVIRTAQIRLEVEDAKETYKKASEICQELGGYLAESKFYKDYEEQQSGSITIRIPKDKFTTALNRLSALGKVESLNTTSQDVAQEYANLKSKLDATIIVYNKMLEALQKRQTTIPEAMRLESELTPILQRIETLKNQIELLNNAVAFTTVTLNFHESKVSVKTLKESIRFIRESILSTAINTVRFFASAIPIVVVGIAWLVFVVGIALFIRYWVKRFFKHG
jgi:hypothetical protein